jgi:hypothetical protein
MFSRENHGLWSHHIFLTFQRACHPTSFSHHLEVKAKSGVLRRFVHAMSALPDHDDIEKKDIDAPSTTSELEPHKSRWAQRLLTWGVEARGVIRTVIHFLVPLTGVSWH